MFWKGSFSFFEPSTGVVCHSTGQDYQAGLQHGYSPAYGYMPVRHGKAQQVWQTRWMCSIQDVCERSWALIIETT